MILSFVSTPEKHLQSNHTKIWFFEMRYIKTKYDYFLFRLNSDFGICIKHDETDCVSEQYRKKEWT